MVKHDLAISNTNTNTKPMQCGHSDAQASQLIDSVIRRSRNESDSSKWNTNLKINSHDIEINEANKTVNLLIGNVYAN